MFRSATLIFPLLCAATAFGGWRHAPGVRTSQAPAAEPAQAPAQPAPAHRTIPAGSRLQIRTIDEIDSKKNSPGQTFRATLDSPLTSGNRVVAPAGSPVTIVLANAQNAGRIKGSSTLELRVTNIRVRGVTYRVSSSVFEETGKSRGKQTAVRTGLGAAAGAVIGGLAGGGKGAAIGAGAGGGAGAGYQALTHGASVKVKPETVLTFQLSAPLRVRI